MIKLCNTFSNFSTQGWFEVDPVIFGLALSMLIQLGAMFQWTIRQSAEVVNQVSLRYLHKNKCIMFPCLISIYDFIAWF
jgi:hypothetical protein